MTDFPRYCGWHGDYIGEHCPDCASLEFIAARNNARPGCGIPDSGDYSGKARHAAMESLIWDLLDPEMYGHAVTAEVRDRARRCVGIKPCETVRK